MTDYILQYYQGIQDGTIVVGKWIRLMYEYVVHGLEQKTFRFDAKKANRAIKFIETLCHHSEGRNDNLILELWQKALVSVLVGIVDESGVRIFREVVLIIGRKNGKTLFASALMAYFVFADGEYGAKAYCIAPKLDQTDIVYSAFRQTCEAEPDLMNLVKPRKTDLFIESTNSSVKRIAFSAKKSDGFNPHFVVCDEIASWQGDPGLKQYEVMKSALGSRKQPMILAISTAGYINDGIYDELIKRSTRFLLGDSKERRLAPFLYTIDDTRKWDDINELKKSNPNLGVSVSVDYLLEEIAVAEGSLSKKAEFLTKYCNVKQNSSQAWLSDESVRKACGEPLRFEDLQESYAVCGIDLSRTTDLTAVTCVIEKHGQLYVFAKFFLPSEKLEEATARDGLPYRAYIQRGILQLSGDNFVDYRDCEAWMRSLVEQYKIYPLMTGYDRYSANYLIQELNQYGFLTDDVYQGFNLSPVIRELEGKIKDGVIHIGDNDLLKIHLLDSALKIDAESERCRLVKLQQNGHIDGTAALLDAFCVRQKHYGELGERLKNEE